MAEKALLGVVDYIIFGMMLLVSAGIGVYFRFSGGKQRTTDEYLLAGRNMPVLPVAFSLMASFLSAITTIGIPAEMYRFGIHLAYMNVGFALGMALSTFLTLPVFFQLQTSSVYEYLDRRFGKFARTIVSVAFVLHMILYMSVVLYAPALALSAVTNMSTWVAVVSIGVVCTFYCTLGGMKAVLWTDVFQALLMFLGMMAVIVKGLMDMGIADIYERAHRGGRLPVPSLDLDPTKRYTVWNLFMQGLILSMVNYGGNQVQVQRLLTMKTLSRSRLALYLSIPMGCGFNLLTCFAGVVIYAHYADCDPITAPDARISSADQLLPYYMMSTLGQYPGLPGLCICGVFSASLSTVSSCVNSLTAVTMQDLVRPFLVERGRSLDKMVFRAKALTLSYGVLCVALTFVVATVGNLLQASFVVFGILGGPTLAIFILGMTTTRTNEKGAVIGLLAGVAILAWISFSSTFNVTPKDLLPVSIEGCTSPNSTLNEILDTPSSYVTYLELTSINSTIAIDPMDKEDDIFILYKISYMWFIVIGLHVTMLVGYVTSLLINLLNGKTEEVSYELISPMVKHFWGTKEKIIDGKDTKNKDSIELHEVMNCDSIASTTGVKADIGDPVATHFDNDAFHLKEGIQDGDVLNAEQSTDGVGDEKEPQESATSDRK